MSWRQAMRREIRQMFVTDRRRAVFLFGASLAYLVLFSLLYGTHTITAVPVVVCDEDQTQFSRALIQAFADSERFTLVAYAGGQEEMEQALRTKEAYAALHIPPHFARDAKSGRTATVLVMVDGANILIANTVTTSAQEIIAAFSRQTGTQLTESNSGQMPVMAASKAVPVDFRLRVLNNPTQSYLSFFILGLAMAALQQGIFLAVGASIHSDFANQDGLPSVYTTEALAGKLLPYWLAGTLTFFLTLAAAHWIFLIPAKDSMPGLLMLSAAFCLCAVTFSAFFASICSTELAFNRLSIAYTVPAFVLSGYTWPQEAMDAVGSALFYTFPLSYFSNTVRELMIAGHSATLYSNSLYLLVLGGVFAGMARICFIRHLRQRMCLSGTADKLEP